MKICKRLSALLFSLLAVVLLLPAGASAAGIIDLGHAHSLTVTAVYSDMPISGLRLDAYLIANVDQYGELSVIDRYEDYEEELDIRGKNDAAWQNMAQILAREILLDPDLKPSRSAVTNSDGVAAFTDIPMGLYLVPGSTIQKNGYVYSTSPFFVMLPEQDLSSTTWSYHVVANAKPGQEPVRANYEVIKVWKDRCHKDQRPKSITISLICDGEVYDTVTLPHEGAWRYTWEDLDTNHQWTVTEKKATGYKEPTVQQEGYRFIVTNTCNKSTTSTGSGKSTLPQTGQLWWPVPVLIAVGLLFVVIGLIRRRSSTDEQ
ncbi:MAG: Cna B-type domain-containing protein [Eubacteriales bacterium]|nr:Cna B-type domain-containing protein [Eubacteriales bacterium]